MRTPGRYAYKNMYFYSFPGNDTLIIVINYFCYVFSLTPFSTFYINLTKFGSLILGSGANGSA